MLRVPHDDGVAAALAHLPEVAAKICRAVGDSQVVHIGVVGWPYPIGWIAGLAALLRHRKLVVVIESAPWRTSAGRLLPRLRSALFEHAARFFCRRADVMIATQPAYLASLRGQRPRGVAAVQSATWISEEHLVSPLDAAARWDARRRRATAPLRALFAGRLLAEKGVAMLPELASRLAGRVSIDVIGEGPLRDSLRDPLRLLETVPYGPRFFELISQYDVLLVPSLSDEQPRIVFDGFAQAVPVVASRTDGIASCVADGVDGWLCEPGSIDDFIRTLEGITPDDAASRGLAGLGTARTQTHERMHERRGHLLREALLTRG